MTGLSSKAPIGVFDSGVGGLSVARQFLRVLPGENLLYFADTAHVPYGGRPLDEVRGFALDICEFLVRSGVKMIVMACNISSATALATARERYPELPIIGVIAPGVHAALAQGALNIGVLATQGTVNSGAYTATVRSLAPHATVAESACPRFVPLIEAGQTRSTEALDAARVYLEPLSRAGCDTVILGCTHYPFMIDALTHEARDLFPAEAQPRFIDPAVETVREAADLLAERGLGAQESGAGTHRYFTSGDQVHVAAQISSFLGFRIDHCIHVDLKAGSHRDAAPLPRVAAAG